MSIKVAIVTGTRAEYGLFHTLLTALEADDRFDVALIVTGAHLMESHGMTVDEIVLDGHKISQRVALPLEDDSELGVAHSTGTAVTRLADAFANCWPSLVVLLGDRYETLAASVAAAILRIPVAHLHGGEVTEGAIDDSMRHAITKLASLHFTSTERHRKRVIQMGEDPDRVFAVGALGVDNVLNTPLLTRTELSEALGFEFDPPMAMITFHPVTLDTGSGKSQLEALLTALDALPELSVVFTMPNADAGNRALSTLIEAWVTRNRGRAACFKSLGRLRYLSAMANCDVVIGNSSSGIIEAPAFHKPSVDVGDRQAGRERAASVTHCEPNALSIVEAVRLALTADGQAAAALATNPYGDGHAAERIVERLATFGSDAITSRKSFYNLEFCPDAATE